VVIVFHVEQRERTLSQEESDIAFDEYARRRPRGLARPIARGSYLFPSYDSETDHGAILGKARHGYMADDDTINDGMWKKGRNLHRHLTYNEIYSIV